MQKAITDFHLALAKGHGGAWRIKSETEIFPGPALDAPVTAAQLVKMLDDAVIRRAVILSDAYYFDISGAWQFGKPEEMAEIVARIRQIGLKRILYASDGPPREAWEAFRKKLPLTESEVRVIANNVAPYMREQPGSTSK